MDLFEAIARRHSYRGSFVPQPIPRDHLQQIVQAGIDAPSAKNAETTSFVILDDPVLLRAAVAIIDRPVCQTAAAMIVCLVDERPVMESLTFAAEDCAAAVENMLLAITALGYASVWLEGALRRERRAERLAELIAAPPELRIRVVLPLGVPLETHTQAAKLPFSQRAWFNRFDAMS